jgi:hypothetical protein
MTLQEDELDGIRDTLTSQATRRKHVAAGLFRVLVDGKEHARFDVKESNNVHFEIGEGAELIEVRTSDEKGELLLASHLLEFDSEPSENKFLNRSIILEAGQKVSFSVKPFHNPAGEMDGAIVDVTYKETSMLRAASLFLQQLKTRVAQGLTSQKWLPVGAIKPLLATLFLALCATIVFFYFQSTKNVQQWANRNSQEVAPNQQDDKENIPQMPPDRAENKDQKNQEPEKDLPQRSPNERENQDKIASVQEGNNKRRDPLVPTPEGRTRNPSPSIIGVPLVEVKSIAIAPYGTETLSPQLREAMADALQASGRFTVAQSSTDVDAVLKISTKEELTTEPDKPESATIIVRLVNRKGYIVWPAKTAGSGKLYSGNINEIAARIAADILREIQKAGR